VSERHLGRWTGPFTESMQSAAETPFFRTLAKVTRVVVDRER
jgi:TorA maturation chaperone TorD